MRGDSAPCTANSEVKVHSDRDHVPVVVKLLVDDVLVLGFDLFEPDIAIGAVDGKMSIEEELQPAARMKPEAVLRIVESPRPCDGGVVPAASPRMNGASRVVPNG